MTVLKLDAPLYDALWDHLLPLKCRREQGAFLFCVSETMNGRFELRVVDRAFLATADFTVQETDYLELADATRASLIKRAHQIGASLVELHSHPGPWPAAFSSSDRRGLRETVPHMWWRLKGRPYAAIVVAPSGFDALVWRENPHAPELLTGIMVGEELLTPTNASLEGWSHDRRSV